MIRFKRILSLVEAAVPEIGPLIDTLQTISTSLMIIAWIAVGIGWYMGWFKMALPVPSRRLKRSGIEEIEMAGLAAFFIAIFSTLITLIVWIIRAIGGVVTPGLP